MGAMVGQSATAELELYLDHKALCWLDEHPSPDALVVAYTVTRCCAGPVCNVRLRREKRSDRVSQQLHQIAPVCGREVLVDARIVDRLPNRVPVTVRGVGRLKHLSLSLEGEEWARLLCW
jgi:hypothetical protein